MPDHDVVIEIIGEGKTDIGEADGSLQRPENGVVPVLTHKFCGRPDSMRVRCKRPPHLQRKKLWQKVLFAKQQAYYSGSAALVFVIDTEGDHPSQRTLLEKGRDAKLADFPSAVGVAHPCIEAWLLADPAAITRALGLAPSVEIPDEPETLPAPCRNKDHNPKTILAGCAGRSGALSAKETTKIAHAIQDLDQLRARCPLGFAPFADEIEQRIKPLFSTGEAD